MVRARSGLPISLVVLTHLSRGISCPPEGHFLRYVRTLCIHRLWVWILLVSTTVCLRMHTMHNMHTTVSIILLEEYA